MKPMLISISTGCDSFRRSCVRSGFKIPLQRSAESQVRRNCISVCMCNFGRKSLNLFPSAGIKSVQMELNKQTIQTMVDGLVNIKQQLGSV